MDNFISQHEKKAFRDICLETLESIITLSRVEFRGGYHKTVQVGNSTHQEYVPSGIKIYCQAVEHFAIILIPHFDDEMSKIYDKFAKEVKELREKKLDPENPEAPRNNKGELEDISKEWWKIRKDAMKQILCQDLFIELNKLLKRKDYLGKAIYSEEDEEDEYAELD